MALLSDSEQQQVRDAITHIEHGTDAELVTVLAPQADDYTYIPLLWAGILALLIPGAINYFPQWLGASELLIVQWACFAVLAIVFRLPAVTTRLIPRRVRFWRAANLARRQFLEQNLHHTQDGTGMLIFVSEAERYVEILVDRGISSRLDDETWQGIVSTFTQQVKQGQTLQGFLSCIEACGEHLREHVPATHERNELPNRLIVLE
ncbi:TPM domain-containing protein [Chromohalobacter sp. HP20-39]|uniref:TPM domain-containing protein n=1 Tax=Chromohalobacter sp. HP20-39 TaxID=3079306 RepID=UPI00294B9627|nr:TPM domain-containing protein [Chromohalobacter sp. HP20-39]MDV6319820.1 TPM domain-containing protein [Chromohalobacter sp. HP20-39]